MKFEFVKAPANKICAELEAKTNESWTIVHVADDHGDYTVLVSREDQSRAASPSAKAAKTPAKPVKSRLVKTNPDGFH